MNEDEIATWFELIAEMGYAPPDKISPLARETNEILAMTVASLKTSRSRKS